ncbi:MAG: hypothetical protein HY279_04475, partial [Nitrospinae bacterium]|nr:hypothetical protein [Nitrospinota bacterium]
HRAMPMTPEQSEQLKSRLGVIGVVSARFIPKLELQTPAKGALAGAGAGAGATLEAGGKGSSGEGAVLGILLAPVGAVAGAVMADSAKDVNEREAIIKKAITEIKTQETIRDRFLKTVQEKTKFQFTLAEGYGPSVDGELPDYSNLKEKGIVTVHEITVKQFGLKGEGKINPDLSLYMILKARLVNLTNNTELFKNTFTCEGERHKFAEWAVNDALLFRQEFERCYQNLSENMMRDIYMLNNIK